MELVSYEPHIHDDPSFPIIFHQDFIKHNTKFLTHWHESVEILCVFKGSITVLSDANSIVAKENELVIISSNSIHHVQALGETADYYCLIVDKRLCEEFGLSIEEISFQNLVNDKKLIEKFQKIKNEFISKKTLYKSVVKAAVIDLMIYLYRDYTISVLSIINKSENIRAEIIKMAIKYIEVNYNNAISTSGIAEKIGLSKSYFCRIFKKTTGYTVMSYVNVMRCSSAKKLFQTGKYTVSEAAFLCGFDNLSYFSKTYKKHMGCLPSSNKKHDVTQDISQQNNEGIPRVYFTD